MKRMTKLLTLVAIFTIIGATTASAQLGIQAGYVNSQIYSEQEEAGDPYNGFEVGINYNMPIMGGFSLQYSLLYTLLTNKEKETLGSATLEYKSTGHYLNLPVRIAYTYMFNRGFGLFAYGGPNFALGLAGKDKLEVGVGEVGGSGDSDWFGKDGRFNRFDVKLGLGIGVKFHSLTLKGGYDWGLMNLFNDDNVGSDIFANRNQFNISLGYSF